MKRIKLRTQFAPPERASKEKVEKQIKLLNDLPLIQGLYNAITEAVLILNKERQIVFYNQSLANLLKVKNKNALFGLRPGEAFNCIYSLINPAGCGTSIFCSTCGAAKAILNGLNNKIDMQESRITKYNSGDALDFLIKSTPFILKGEQFVIITLKDISHEKRRQFLERIFFHDILNIISRLQINVEFLKKTDSKRLEIIKNNLLLEVNKLIEEINTQKMILAAEKSELVPNLVPIETRLIIEELIRQYDKFAEKKHVKLQKILINNIIFKTDFSILLRVLGNMLKNAIEASNPEDIVKIKCYAADKKVNFSIHNPGVMPKNIQLQIFQRSFSTKGTGRGLGTYSMKLLTERYLKGKVFFTSSNDKGTIFIASYPKK